MNSVGKILALSASDRFHAATGWFHGSQGFPLTALIPIGLAVGAGIVVLAIFAWQRKSHSRSWQVFHEQAARMGMTKAQQEMLQYIVQAESLRNPMTILTTEGVFQQASAALVAGEKFTSLKKETQQELTAIIKSTGEKLDLAFSGTVQRDRFIDRWKFARVKTQQKAMVAPLPFLSDSSRFEGIQAVAGKLLEIAGPGFLIQVQGQFSVGEKVVVMVKLQDKQVISGVGKVRRVQADANGESSIGGELIDLGQEELSRMVRETHAAERLGAEQSRQTTEP